MPPTPAAPTPRPVWRPWPATPASPRSPVPRRWTGCPVPALVKTSPPRGNLPAMCSRCCALPRPGRRPPCPRPSAPAWPGPCWPTLGGRCASKWRVRWPASRTACQPTSAPPGRPRRTSTSPPRPATPTVRRRRLRMKDIERAAQLAPDEARYAYVLGVVLHAAGRTGDALQVPAQRRVSPFRWTAACALRSGCHARPARTTAPGRPAA